MLHHACSRWQALQPQNACRDACLLQAAMREADLHFLGDLDDKVIG